MEHLFGSEGHCKSHGITAVLATHIVSVVQYADTMIELSPSGDEEYYGRAVNWPKFSESISVFDGKDETDDNSDSSEIGKDKSDVNFDEYNEEEDDDDDDERTVLREVGDFSIWAYYFGKMSLVRLAIAIFFMLLAVIASSFPSKFTSRIERCLRILTIVFRDMVEDKYRW